MALPAIMAIGVGLQAATGIFGMIQSSRQQKKAEEMRKRMEAQTQATNQQLIAQFQASSGLSTNVGFAAGNQQGVPGGQFPGFC